MTTPRRSPFAKPARPQVALLEKLAEVEAPVSAPVSPFATPAPVSPFAQPAAGSPFAGPSGPSPFAAPSGVEGAFARLDGPSGKLGGASGKLGRGASGKLSLPSGRLSRTYGGKQVIRKLLLPPPPEQTPEWSHYWLHWCEMKDVLERQYEDMDSVEWAHGNVVDFEEVADIGGGICADDAYFGEGLPEGHEQDDEGRCLSHRLWANHSSSLDLALGSGCDYPYFDASAEWEEMVGLLKEMRAEVFDRGGELVTIADNRQLDRYFRLAGVPDELTEYLDRRAMQRVILSALESGNMLGRAVADHAPLDQSEFFAQGDRLDELQEEMNDHCSLVQPVDEQIFVFKAFHRGTQFKMGHGGMCHPLLRGDYTVTQVEYQSALMRPGAQHRHGFVGFRVIYLEPSIGDQLVKDPMAWPPQ